MAEGGTADVDAPSGWQDGLAARAADWRAAKWLAANREAGHVLIVLLLVGALGSLVALNYLVGSLWGELIYGIVVTTAAIWALSHVRPVRWLLTEWDEPGFSVPRAALWATFAVVAFPVAILRGKWAVVALVAAPLGWVVYRAVRHELAARNWLPEATPERRGWIFGALGLIVLAGFLWLLPHVPHVSRVVVAETRTGPLPAPAPENATDAELAWHVRPVLLFDRGESRVPLDITDAIGNRRVWACTDGDCGEDPIARVSDITRAADYIRVDDVTGVRGGGGGSAYYYHVYDKSPNRIYVDYWWFFTRNPSPVGAAVGCGPAARWVGLTCHDHPSDWEGVTVVLDRCTGDRERCVRRGAELWNPVAVRYAQHEHTVSYAWKPTLARLWLNILMASPARPLVYIAKDSHASYPTACSRRCEQYASYPLLTWKKRDEAPFDGGLEWRLNTDRCARIDPGSRPQTKPLRPDCLRALPITEDGRAASWNAFTGPWGTQTCIIAGTYCDTSKAPYGPSEQDRYRNPGEKGPWRCLAPGRPPQTVPKLEDCGDAAADEEIRVAG
jgi:hypothetical protein